MKIDAAQKARIRKELKKTGLKGYGLISMEARYLPSFIHDNEHIEAAVYGFYKDGTCMLVATNLRIIFLDRKPLYTVMDEIRYEMVAGVGVNNLALFAGVILHTRVRDFKVNHVMPKVANKFAHYIEIRRVASENGDQSGANIKAEAKDMKDEDTYVPMTEAAKDFLKNRRLATLSSVGKDGNVYGAVVYYAFDEETDKIYMLTKTGTQKSHNILANPNHNAKRTKQQKPL